MSTSARSVFPGINKLVNWDILSKDESTIVRKLSVKYWYVTRIQEIILGESVYKAVLIKPTEHIVHTFNLIREIVVLFSPYDVFQPRVFDALDELEVQDLRLEEICSFVISKDPTVSSAISNILKSNQESRIFIPFTYKELLSNLDSFDEFFISRMRQCFYSRDLFGIQDPLKQELYFFGRRELIQELANKNLCGENSGIFGLRKTGKTSILFGVERALHKKNAVSAFIDCQTLHNKPWNLALQYVMDTVASKCAIKKSVYEANHEKYASEEYAADAFFSDIDQILCNNGKRNILIIFDEIENISYGTSASESWRKGDSFVKFWQVIRSTFQRQNHCNKFTYIIAGTNPRCIELSSINDVDNPVFHQFTPQFIEPFDLKNTEEMLNRLGGYMGLRFSTNVCTHILEDFGGHPLLMRQICSFIHKAYTGNRPVSIEKQEYLEFKKKFYEEQTGFSQYASMILDVLSRWYEDEYQMLTFLATGDYDNFKFFAQDNDYIKHLINYGVIASDKTSTGYHFRIEALEDYLREKNKYRRPIMSNEEKEQETQERRSAIEKKLRKLIKRQLVSSLGENLAKEEMIRAIYGSKEIGHKSNLPYKDFFDPDKHEIYLSTLISVIDRNFDHFKNLFGVNKEVFDSKATLLNKYRRTDAHSAPIADADFETFRGIASWFEDILKYE